MSFLRSKPPLDLVAIFHASFHPTKGNILDWSLKASDDITLDNVEFSALPSGLHLVSQDVVYFTKDHNRGVCIFRRRPTSEQGHRGFRLSSLGILLAPSVRPRPWEYVPDLKELVGRIYGGEDQEGEVADEKWEEARAWFEERKLRGPDLGGVGRWNGWSDELDEPSGSKTSSQIPTLHLPHLLRILGPSTLTLYKYILGRRRILVYTLPPVEAACILCQVAGDMCFEAQVDYDAPDVGGSGFGGGESIIWGDATRRMKGRCREGINVLGMVNLNDLGRMESEGKSGRGWIACTTDAIFLEKPTYYDLVIDLTTSTPSKATRPTFYASRLIEGHRNYKLSVIRFTWSDIKLWNELERLLFLDTSQPRSASHLCCSPSPQYPEEQKSKAIPSWTDVWLVYEDVCVICAGLWMGSWRGNSRISYSTGGGREWGAVRLEGDDDLSFGMGGVRNVREGIEWRQGRLVAVRSIGEGIEGRPSGDVAVRSVGEGIEGGPSRSTSRGMRRSGGMSWKPSSNTPEGARPAGSNDDGSKDVEERHERQIRTTLALLQTLHANTCFQLSQLETLLPPEEERNGTVYLTPKDVLSFELGPFSSLDSMYLEWLAEEYAGGGADGLGKRVVVKRGWKDLLGFVFGFG